MLLWHSLVTTAARLLVMGLLVFSQTSACELKSVHQERHKINVDRALKTRSLARELVAGTANPASLVQQGSHITFNATLKFKYYSPEFPSVLSSDGTVLAIGFAPGNLYYPDKDNRVYVYHLSNPNTTRAKWVQTAYFTTARPSNSLLRGTVALSGDGKILAIGAGNASSGSVMVYRFQANTWVPLGSVSPVADFGFPEFFGYSLALSFSGFILAVHTYLDETLDFFRWNGTALERHGSLASVSPSFSMSHDGNVVAVIDSFSDSVQTYRFVASASGGWVQFGKDISLGNDVRTYAVSLSGNGKRVGALALSGSKSILRVFEFYTTRNDWTSVGPGVTQTFVSDYFYGGPSVSLSNGGSLVAELRGGASSDCPGEVRVYKVTKNGTWPQIYKYEGPYIRSLTGISAALSGDGQTLAVADFGFETYHVFSNN